jgi:hypothetical protein
MLQFCNKKNNNKILTIPLEREIARAAKTVGKCERMMGNIVGISEMQIQVEEKFQQPERFEVREEIFIV